MLDVTSKALFHGLAQVPALQRFASSYGMRPGGFARRFIAGETVEEAIAAVVDLPGRGLALTLDYLGESVASVRARPLPGRSTTAAMASSTVSPAMNRRAKPPGRIP